MKSYHVAFLIAIAMGITNLDAQIDSRKTSDDLINTSAKADTLPWKLRQTIGLGFSTVQLNNWSGGGQNSITMRGLYQASADYITPDYTWDNDIDLGYSLTKQGSAGFRKSDDRFILTSKASVIKTEQLRYTAFMDFRTQLYIGRNYDVIDSVTGDYQKISNWFAPAYLTGALGLEYVPEKFLKILVAPVSARGVFVNDADLSANGAFGVTPGKSTKFDFGGLINVNLDWLVADNLIWKSRATAFCRYEMPDLWVLTWENQFVMRVNEWLNVTFMTDVFYDDKVPVIRDDKTTGPATQVRNQLVVNIAWTMQNW